MNEVVTVKSARKGASTVHLAINVGWSSPPLCGMMKTGGREFTAETSNCTPCFKEAQRRMLDIDGLIRISSRVWNLVNGVKAHATENYNTGGWDVIVEAWSDHAIAEEVKTCRTTVGALARMASIVSLYTERQADARISAGEDHPEPVAPAKPESVIRWSGCDETEWYGTETWSGKVGRNEIGPDGVRYVSGFHLNLTSPGACDHKPGGWPHCRQDACRHADCVNVPF